MPDNLIINLSGINFVQNNVMKLYNTIRIISLKNGWHYIANRKGRMTNLMTLEEAAELYKRMVNIVKYR